MTSTNPGARAATNAGLAHQVIQYERVSSVQEAADARGVPVSAVVKSLLVRRDTDDYVIVLVPGDRNMSWPKVREALGVSRLSMPDPASAKDVTGYERGTITPLGLTLPLVADERLRGEWITLGSGEHSVAIGVNADDIIDHYSALVADVSDSAN